MENSDIGKKSYTPGVCRIPKISGMYSKYLCFVVPCITNVPIRTILDDEIIFSLLLIYTAIGFLC